MTRITTDGAARRARHDFLVALENALDRPAVRLRRKHTVAWREDDTLDHVYVYAWHGRDQAAPRISRIAVNHYRFTASRRTLTLLGVRASDRPARREELHLEMTVLDTELAEFARWLPLWVAGRIEQTATIPEPPHACHVWHQGWETADYAWSVAAWEANRAWREEQDAAKAARLAHRRSAQVVT